MKLLLTALTLLLTCTLQARTLDDLRSEWFIINQHAQQVMAAENYPEALTLAEEAYKFAQKHIGLTHPDTVISINNLANSYRENKQPAKAKVLLNKAYVITLKNAGLNTPQMSMIINNLATAHKDLKEYEKAITLYKRAIRIKQDVYHGFHQSVATSQYNLANLYLKRGHKKDYPEADNLLKHALVIWQKTLGKNHSNVQGCYFSLAKLYKETNREALGNIMEARAHKIQQAQQ